MVTACENRPPPALTRAHASSLPRSTCSPNTASKGAHCSRSQTGSTWTKAALYYYFRSKDDLLEALVEPAITGVTEILDACSDEPDTPARRKAFLKQYLDYFLQHRRLIAYISRDLATLAHPAISAGNEERRARMEAILGGSDLDFSDQVRVTMAFGGMQAAIAQYPDADEADLREALLDAGAALLRPRRGPGKKLNA